MSELFVKTEQNPGGYCHFLTGNSERRKTYRINQSQSTRARSPLLSVMYTSAP